MKRLHSWTGLVATSFGLALAPAYLLADTATRSATPTQSAGPTAAPAESMPPGGRTQRPNAAAATRTQSAGPTAAPAEVVPPGVRAQRPNAAAAAAETREKAATQRTRQRRTPKAQTKYKEARGQEPQLVDVPDPVDINSD